MLLRSLDDKLPSINVFILETSSTKLALYLQDKVKKSCGASKDTTFTIESKKDYKRVKDICNIVPPLSNKWLVYVNITKLRDTKELVKLIQNSTTVMFFCTSDKYMDYKMLKTSLEKHDGVVDFYFSRLGRNDLLYLYDAFVPSKNKLSKKLFDYVASGYNTDIDAIFDLFLELAQGTKVSTRKDISEICGVGGNSIESFVFSLLKPPPVTEKGLGIVVKNRLTAGLDLMNVYGQGVFLGRVRGALSRILDIKVLLLGGAIYNKVINLPEPYDEKLLSKYQRYLWKIKEIPTSRIVRCMYFLQKDKRWSSDIDFVKFIYCYFLDLERFEVKPYIEILQANMDENVENDISIFEEEDTSGDLEKVRNELRIDNSNEAIHSVYVDALKRGLVEEVSGQPVESSEVEEKKTGRYDLFRGIDTSDFSPIDIARIIAGEVDVSEIAEKQRREENLKKLIPAEKVQEIDNTVDFLQNLLKKGEK